MNYKIIIFFLLLISNLTNAQDTIRLNSKPKVILKSWYPEFKEFPKLKIGEAKIIFIAIPNFDKLSIKKNQVNLKTTNSKIQIESTDKINQYLVNVNSVKEKFAEFEIWLKIEDVVLLLKEKSKWKNIKQIYKTKNNFVLIDTVKLKVIK